MKRSSFQDLHSVMLLKNTYDYYIKEIITGYQKQTDMLTAGTMILLVFVLVNVVAEALLQPVLAMFFGHSTVISRSPGKSFVPQIAVSGSNVYLVWMSSG